VNHRGVYSERYRDLIDAADSIIAMRNASDRVSEMLGGMQEACNVRQLKTKAKDRVSRRSDNPSGRVYSQLTCAHIMFGMRGLTGTADDSKKQKFLIAAQIKLLVDTPEQASAVKSEAASE
jgi:hypothetical protein